MTPEISLPVDLPAAAKSNKGVLFNASPEQCRAVAKRLGVLEVTHFKTTFDVRKGAGGVYRVAGHITADLLQACVRTLKPVTESVDEKFSVNFMSDKAFEKRSPEEDDGEIEDIEILEDKVADLGEVAVQYLSLFIDPFPTVAGKAGGKAGEIETAGLGDKVAVYSEETFRDKSSPFAILKKPKKNKEEG